MPKVIEIIVEVSGKFPFPIDMLRYDGLCPDGETDSYNILASITREKYAGPIRLRRYAHAGWTPTQGRWDSFGWKVTNVYGSGRVLR